MLKNRRLNQLLGVRLIGLIIIFCAYAPGVFTESFWSDDYPALTDINAFASHVLGDARPTASAMIFISFSMLGSPAEAWILRFLALIALIFLFIFISKRIKTSKLGNLSIFSMALAFCLPSFQMYIHWSVTWLFLWAALLGVYAFHFWSSKQPAKRFFAVVLLTLALTIYPPTALFFFAVIAVTNTLNKSKISMLISDLVQGISLLIISGVVSVFMAIISLQIASVSPNKRVALLSFSEIPEKLIWLISRPLVVGLRPFMIDSPTVKVAIITALPVFIVLVNGIRKQSLSLGENPFIRAVWIAIPLLITLSPLMVTSANQIEFRLLPGYCWAIATLSCFFLLEIVEARVNSLKLHATLKQLSLLLVPVVLSSMSIISINSHFWDLFGGPYQKKNSFFYASISACEDKGTVKSFVIFPPKLPFPEFDRLGVYSMSTDLASGWVPKSNLELLLKQRNVNATVRFLEVRPNNSQPFPTECVIDLENFRKLLV